MGKGLAEPPAFDRYAGGLMLAMTQASLRASQFLILGSKARALVHGRYNVSVEDIQTLAYPVFRHRILTNFHAESEGIKSEDIIKRLLETVPLPKSGLKD